MDLKGRVLHPHKIHGTPTIDKHYLCHKWYYKIVSKQNNNHLLCFKFGCFTLSLILLKRWHDSTPTNTVHSILMEDLLHLSPRGSPYFAFASCRPSPIPVWRNLTSQHMWQLPCRPRQLPSKYGSKWWRPQWSTAAEKNALVVSCGKKGDEDESHASVYVSIRDIAHGIVTQVW